VTISRLEHAREELPAAVATAAQLIVDNPAQFVLVGAAAMVATRAVMNLVKPRTPAQALAVFIVLQAGIPVVLRKAIGEGWLKFRIRDDEGHLVPLEVPRPGQLYFYPDHGIGCRGHSLDEVVRERVVVPDA
jgi:hypothetical protein